MVGFLVKRILFPIILCFLIVAISYTLIPVEYEALRLYPAIVYLIVLVYWWLTGLARWLVRRWRWVTVGYLLTNFAVAMVLMSGLITASFALAPYNETLSMLAGLAALIAGPGWLIYSVIHLLRHGQRRRKGILWGLLADWLEETFEETPPAKQPPAKKRRTSQESNRAAPATRVPTSSPQAKRATASKPLFTQVGAGGDTATVPGVAIPPRTSTQRLVGNDPQEFVQQAHEWALRQEYVGNYVPFETAVPTYRQMSFEQEQWYFYWRTQLRQGNFMATDLSYLLIYVYELLNLAGVNAPTDARDRLVTFWQFYRSLQPKLDTLLVDWVADFGVLNELPESTLAWYAHALSVGATSRNTETLQLEAWHQQGRDYSALPATALYTLSGFATQQNKFYQSYQNELALDDAFKRGVEAIDKYVQQTQQLSLYELHLPAPTQTVVRLPLQGAVHRYPSTPIVIGRVRPWLAEETLKNDLRAILRYTENILRTQAAYKTKLRGVTLPPAWATVLDQAFFKAPPKRVVTIDLAGAAALQRESDELRQRLLDTGNVTESETDPLPVAEPALPAAPSGDIAQIQRPNNVPDGLLTDLPALTTILGDATTEATALLRALRAHAWQTNPANLKAASTFVSVTFDQINERALQELGDALIFVEGEEWVVAEDYRDEIAYLLDHPDFAVDAGATPPVTPSVSVEAVGTSSEGGQLEVIPVGWEEFVRRMQPPLWATLMLIGENRELEAAGVMAKLETLARSHYVTANQLLDQSNEIALETIGDNLIDVATTPPQIIDEYREPLQALLLWAKENHQIEGLS